MFDADRSLVDLDPAFEQCVLKWLALCRGNGINVLITEGKRSKSRQWFLWTRGRFNNIPQEKAFLGFVDPNIIADPKAKQVTWKLNSWHIPGKAIDFCFLDNGKASWADTMPWNHAFDLAEQ